MSDQQGRTERAFVALVLPLLAVTLLGGFFGALFLGLACSESEASPCSPFESEGGLAVIALAPSLAMTPLFFARVPKRTLVAAAAAVLGVEAVIVALLLVSLL